jgi:hypothetical protein
MRTTGRFVLILAAVGASLGVAAVPGGAGAPAVNTVTIEKVVVGTAPEGTIFAVSLDCQGLLSPGAAAIPALTFDADGNPLANNTFNVPGGEVCTVTETATGGATTVGYACAIVRGGSDQVAPFLGNCTGDNEVTFTDVIGDAATVTITNTFAGPTPPPGPPVTQAVQVTPTFTG